MTDLEQRVREAFDEVTVPDCVKRDTLTYIGNHASREEAQGFTSVSASVSAATSGPTPDPTLVSAATPVADRAPASAATPVSAPAPDPAPARRRANGFRAFSFKRVAAAVAACLVLAAVGFGGFAYAQPTARVGIDVNPSLELGVNRFGLVVETKALNDDGRALLDAVSLTGLAYADALAALTESDAFAPYTQENSYIEISVTTNNEAQAQQLRTESDARLQQLPCHGSCHAVDEATSEAAAAAGMGVGRYRAALELMELDSSVTLDECATLSMHELRDRIAVLKGELPETKGNGHGEGHGAGQGSGKGAGHGHGGAK